MRRVIFAAGLWSQTQLLQRMQIVSLSVVELQRDQQVLIYFQVYLSLIYPFLFLFHSKGNELFYSKIYKQNETI